MRTLMIRLLVFLALTGSANAGQTTYDFNFSAGGTGSFIYDDVAKTTSAIRFDFGALGSIAPYSFGADLTATVFGTPPTAAIRQDGTFFGVTRVGETLTATVRLYTNGTFCVRPYPEPTPDSCLVSGTYKIAPSVVPPAPFVIAEFAPDVSHQFGISGFSSSFARTGQTFTVSRDGRLDTIRVLLAANGSIPPSVAIEVRPVDPNTGLSGSAVLASAAANTSTLSSTPAYYTASFSGSDVVLRRGATYAWTLRPTGTNTGATAYGDLSGTGDPYPGGAYQRSNDAGTTWIQQAGNYDLAFRVTAVTPVVASNDIVFGAGAVSTDFANRAEWLDLPLTQGRSPAEIVAGYGGYASGGFRFATTDEVAALWAAFGLTHVGTATADPLQVSAAQSILSQMGSTSTGAGFSTLGGHTLHPSLAGQYTQSSVEVFTTVSWCSGFGLPAPCMRALVQNGSMAPTAVSDWVGAMLVREIPTPDQAFFPFNFIGGDIAVNGYQIGGNLAQQLAQTFTAASNGTLTSVEVHIGGFGDGTQPINVAVRATGQDGLPLDGTPLASATIRRASLPATATFTRISFASPPQVTAGSRLAIVLSSDETVGSYQWTGSTSFAQFKPPFYAAGAGFFRNSDNPDWRESGTTDYGFRAYIQPAATPVDVTAPSLVLPPNMTVAATGASGAVVTFAASATDDTDTAPAVSCSPASGSTFALGPTTVSCTATDASGNLSQRSFTITVLDDAAPVISGNPGSIQREATGPLGAVVTWTALTGNDAVSGAVTVTCSPASGATFPRTTTAVNCSAVDAAGNSASTSFTVTVVDTTPPVLSGGSGNLTVQVNRFDGAQVFYALPAATDLVTAPLAPSCSPAPGSVFPITTTSVTCNAVDAAGNQAVPKTFTITVVDTIAPSVSGLSPTRDAMILTTPVTATVFVTDTTGATSVTINSIAATRISGTPQSGTWRASGATTIPAMNLTLTAVARDAFGNSRTLSHVIDNDGIYASIDRNRAGTADQSNFYSHEFRNGATDGVIATRGGSGRLVRVQPNGGPVYTQIYGAGTSQAVLNVCGAPTRYVYMDTNEAADLACLPPTVAGSTATLQAYIFTAANGSVDILKQAVDQRFATYQQCGWYSSWGSSTSTYRCYSYQAPVYSSYWYLIRAPQWATITTGSPVTYEGYSQKNPPPEDVPEDGEPAPPSPAVDLPDAPALEVLILRALDDGDADDMGTVDLENATVVGSFILDKLESAEIDVTAGATPDSEQVVLNVLNGSVPVTIGGATRVGTPGQPATLMTDNAAPVLGAAADVLAYADSDAGMAVSFPLPAATDNSGPPTVTSSPASGSVFPLGDTTVTVTATDAAGNYNTTTFKLTVRLKSSQTITFAPIGNKTFGDGPFTLDASSTSGLAVTFAASGSCSVANGVVTLTAANACTITAAQPGNAQYFAAQSVSQTFSVQHTWSGVLQPVNADGSSIFKLGSTVPVKFTLIGGSAQVANLAARIYVARVANGVIGTEMEATAIVSADSGNTFRYGTDGQYVFNWGTKGLGDGTWQLRIDLLDGHGARTVLVSLRK